MIGWLRAPCTCTRARAGSRILLLVALAPACDVEPEPPGRDVDAVELEPSDTGPGELADAAPSRAAIEVLAISAGDFHTCALLNNQTARCWGANWYGQLGYGHTDQVGGEDGIPITVAGDVPMPAGVGVDMVAAGGRHTCVVTTNDEARCWGHNYDGQLGLGHTKNVGDELTPDEFPPINLAGAAMVIAAGERHSCATVIGGRVRCWGRNGAGQLGLAHTETIGDNESPSQAGGVVLERGWIVELAAGREHTCARSFGGAAYCWGASDRGQLGQATTQSIGDDEYPAIAGPVSVSAEGLITQLAAGGDHTCALLDDGSVRCWGDNTYGQLGYGHTDVIGDDEPPKYVSAVNVGGAVKQLAAGTYHTCALLTSGAVRCWGNGDYGQLGYGNTKEIGDNEQPASVGAVQLGGAASQITAGFLHTCALLTTGAVRCWGWNVYGQLGYDFPGRLGDNELPTAVAPVPVL
ncbi:MAG: hypothetical protein H6713_02135 [Myxococcales bacterium]|nr:hypothetical protein [Myxococcales bacterium]